MPAADLELFRFADAEAAAAFSPRGDPVMGGASTGAMAHVGFGVARFSGELVTVGGGFASVLAELPGSPLDARRHRTLVLRVRGDGRAYSVLVRDARDESIRHGASLGAVPAAWSERHVPLASLLPRQRGRPVLDGPPLDRSRLTRLGLLVADGRPGPFWLELAWIRLRA